VAPVRLAIVATHPIQYAAPWFAEIARKVDVKVFYLWDAGVQPRRDPGFGHAYEWDIPLLEGYDHAFLDNRSPCPGTSRFGGLWNPDLIDRVRDSRADAVLVTTYNYASIWYFLMRWRRAWAPLLFRGDSHRLVPQSGLLTGAKRFVIARIFARFDAFLYVGAANRDYFRLHRVPEGRLFHCPHAVDNDRFIAARPKGEADAMAWRASLGIPRDRRVILFAGKFEEKKRPLDLLRAFETAGISNAALLFVGAGPQERLLREAAGRVAGVYFAPFQNQSQMPRTYAASDLFVLPSYGPAETWGLAVNEAMCLGRPVIVSEHVGCAADLVIPNETGLRFPAGNVEALAGALRTAFEDPERLRRWGQNAFARIGRFSYRESTEGLMRAIAAVRPRC
jgi:glycosyltransferase involved in cell wall biosynthesis